MVWLSALAWAAHARSKPDFPVVGTCYGTLADTLFHGPAGRVCCDADGENCGCAHYFCSSSPCCNDAAKEKWLCPQTDNCTDFCNNFEPCCDGNTCCCSSCGCLHPSCEHTHTLNTVSRPHDAVNYLSRTSSPNAAPSSPQHTFSPSAAPSSPHLPQA